MEADTSNLEMLLPGRGWNTLACVSNSAALMFIVQNDIYHFSKCHTTNRYIILYIILHFASWLSKPKTLARWLFKEKFMDSYHGGGVIIIH